MGMEATTVQGRGVTVHDSRFRVKCDSHQIVVISVISYEAARYRAIRTPIIIPGYASRTRDVYNGAP